MYAVTCPERGNRNDKILIRDRVVDPPPLSRPHNHIIITAINAAVVVRNRKTNWKKYHYRCVCDCDGEKLTMNAMPHRTGSRTNRFFNNISRYVFFFLLYLTFFFFFCIDWTLDVRFDITFLYK